MSCAIAVCIDAGNACSALLLVTVVDCVPAAAAAAFDACCPDANPPDAVGKAAAVAANDVMRGELSGCCTIDQGRNGGDIGGGMTVEFAVATFPMNGFAC